ITQRDQPSLIVDLDPHRLARFELIKSTRSMIRREEALRRWIRDAGTRKHAAQGITPENALLAPKAVLRPRLIEARHWEFACDPLPRRRLQHGAGCQTERGNDADAHQHDDRQQTTRTEGRGKQSPALR